MSAKMLIVIITILYFLQTNLAKPEISSVIPIPQAPDEEPFDEFNFRKFAATYFLGNISHLYSRRPLKHSLLELPSPIDKIAAQALWMTILRFMGDLSEPKYVDDKVDNIPVMTKLTESIGRAFQKTKEFEVNIGTYLGTTKIGR